MHGSCRQQGLRLQTLRNHKSEPFSRALASRTESALVAATLNFSSTQLAAQASNMPRSCTTDKTSLANLCAVSEWGNNPVTSWFWISRKLDASQDQASSLALRAGVVYRWIGGSTCRDVLRWMFPSHDRWRPWRPVHYTRRRRKKALFLFRLHCADNSRAEQGIYKGHPGAGLSAYATT